MTEPTGELSAPEQALAAVKASAADIDQVHSAAKGCRACDLWEHATQTVFGQGPVPARLMLVGEQPGDQEDLRGAPFIGPAGSVLDRALVEAGIDREQVFVTNLVKHFKWRPRPGGKRRLHERPTRAEVQACLPWVHAEVALVNPEALLVMGSTAAKGLVGADVQVARDHGVPLDCDLAPLVVVTIHPSAVLRAVDDEARAEAFTRLVGDLQAVVTVLDERAGVTPSAG